MRKCAEAVPLMRVFAEKGSVLAVSDAACGAALLKSAMQCAWLNVLINTKSLKDREYARRVNGEGLVLLKQAIPEADAILGAVTARLEAQE